MNGIGIENVKNSLGKERAVPLGVALSLGLVGGTEKYR